MWAKSERREARFLNSELASTSTTLATESELIEQHAGPEGELTPGIELWGRSRTRTKFLEAIG
jgi:hypothetical protein